MIEPGSGPEIEALVAAKYDRRDVALAALDRMSYVELAEFIDHLAWLVELAERALMNRPRRSLS